MKIFKNKFLVKLIASICIFLTLLNFTGTNKVYAAAADEQIWGGVLLDPIIDLMGAIGDFIMNILHDSVQDQDDIFIPIDGSPKWYEYFAIAVGIIIGIVAAIAFIVIIPGVGAAISAAVASVLGTAVASAPFVVTLGTVAGGIVSGILAGTAIKEAMIPNDIDLPLFSITAEKIFANDIALCDVNFFNPNEYVNDEDEQVTSIAEQLQGIVSTWYFILRNLALLVLMLLLIYSGIRIVIGSTAGEKAKYKERLTDWLVAICLVFIMHYIMVFAVEIVERLTEFIGTTSNGNVAYLELTPKQKTSAEEVLDGFDTTGDGDVFDDSGNLIWPTDLAGLFKIESQMTEDGTYKWAGYALCYVVLVLFTLFFLFTYIRRVLYMAFLTIIAPLVAMTYPIDKITDGKAQAFDSWLKEYIFNLMIQPMHLILYTVLVSSAFSLASQSPVYALVALGFMMPAEKLIRSFFGFKKANTPGLLGGAAGAAIAMTGLQSLMKHKSNGGKDGNGGGKQEQNKVKFANRNPDKPMDAIAGGSPSRTTSNTQQQNVNNANTAAPRDDEPDDNNYNTAAPRDDEPYEDSILRNTTLESGDWDHDGFEARANPNAEPSSNYEMDEDDILSNTTLGDEDLDHDGINTNNIEEVPIEETSEPQAPEEQSGQMQPLQSPNPPAQVDPIAFGYDRSIPKPDTKARRIARAAGTLVGSSVKLTGQAVAAGALRAVHPSNLGKIALGVTGATAGMLLGVASGDAKQTFQNATAGAVAGSALASSLSRDKVGEVSSQELEMAYYGADYKEAMIKKQKKEFVKDTANINYLRQTMGVSKQEAQEILKNTGGKCFDKGITNIEDIATIHQLTNGEEKLSPELAIAARNYAKKRLPADTDSMTEDEIESRKARWAKEYIKAGYVKEIGRKKEKDKKTGKITEKIIYDEEQAKALADKSFDLAIKFNKAKSNLTKHPTAK